MLKTRTRRKPRRHLFKIATPGIGRGGNCVLNFNGGPQGQLLPVAEQYHKAARALVEIHSCKPHFHDMEAYPIVFNYRHALELALKCIAGIGNLMTHVHHDQSLRTKKPYDGHQLSRFVPAVKKVCETLNWPYGPETLGVKASQFEAVVKEFDRLDPLGTTFRYTVTKKGTANIEKSFIFSPTEFANVIDPILDHLSSLIFSADIVVQDALDVMYG